jgi:hypothetical protein
MTLHRRPNLFLVGALKAGTTSLWSYLKAHPQVFMCEPKEPAFFADPEELRVSQFLFAQGFAGNEARYLELFQRAPAGARVLGEASAVYSQIPLFTGIPERIAKFNPEARIVYILRDPIERAVSHYLFLVQGGVEKRDPWLAFNEGAGYVDFSRYAMQLIPYLELFGSERVRVLTLEELSARPRETLRGLFRWLGVDDSFEAVGGERRYNVTDERVFRAASAQTVRRLERSGVARALWETLPGWLRKLLRKRVLREETRESVMTPQMLDFLREALLEPTGELSAMLGRRFETEWKTLYGS